MVTVMSWGGGSMGSAWWGEVLVVLELVVEAEPTWSDSCMHSGVKLVTSLSASRSSRNAGSAEMPSSSLTFGWGLRSKLRRVAESGRQWETLGIYCWVYLERLTTSRRRSRRR